MLINEVPDTFCLFTRDVVKERALDISSTFMREFQFMMCLSSRTVWSLPRHIMGLVGPFTCLLVPYCSAKMKRHRLHIKNIQYSISLVLKGIHFTTELFISNPASFSWLWTTTQADKRSKMYYHEIQVLLQLSQLDGMYQITCTQTVLTGARLLSGLDLLRTKGLSGAAQRSSAGMPHDRDHIPARCHGGECLPHTRWIYRLLALGKCFCSAWSKQRWQSKL